eukprot:7391871-Prymnesium_polylepis.1
MRSAECDFFSRKRLASASEARWLAFLHRAFRSSTSETSRTTSALDVSSFESIVFFKDGVKAYSFCNETGADGTCLV